jgi:hypothetical protein
MTTTRLALLVLVGLVGCDDGLALDRDDVTSIPPGTGAGTAASGRWLGRLTTTACHGSCLVSGRVSICDVGDIDEYDFVLTQMDGHLVIEAEGLRTPSMVGGIDLDGSFRVGGYATQLGGSVITLSETLGVVEGQTFTGTARASTEGSYDDEDFACDAEYTTHGERDGV